MSVNSYMDIFRHYQEDIKDEDLLNEAIATLEHLFSYMELDDLKHHSRPYAISYLALMNEKKKRENA